MDDSDQDTGRTFSEQVETTGSELLAQVKKIIAEGMPGRSESRTRKGNWCSISISLLEHWPVAHS